MTMEMVEPSFVPDAAQWAQRQWSSVDVHDVRLQRRAVETGRRMALLPSGSLPQQMKSWAPLKAAYRLLNNGKVSHENISEPHWRATREQAALEPWVLLVQDVTHLDYTRYADTMQGLGPIGNGTGQGLLLHTTLAVTPQPRSVLGIAHQQVFLRVPVPDRKARRKRPKAERESRVWGEAVQVIGAPPVGSRWVVVTDRAGDNTDFLLTCREQGVDFNVRMAYEHRLVTDEGPPAYLLSTARSWLAVAGKILEVRGRGGRPARQARLLVSFGCVRLSVPQGQTPLQVWVVRAWEIDAPPDVEEPVEWILATTVPVSNAQDALERLDWYTARWVVEDYHQCLKTGCNVEHRDLEHADRIKRLLGFLAPIAVRLLQLREEARLDPESPAVVSVDPAMVTIVAHRLSIPADKMTKRTFWRGVARLGGFIGRRGDADPGWKTLWRGWLYLATLAEGVRLAASLHDP
jgi:hypothetical protein